MRGRIPPHRTDAGAFLTAEVVGARCCILVTDERGLFTHDPKKDPSPILSMSDTPQARAGAQAQWTQSAGSVRPDRFDSGPTL
jgi:glutamate 5-kinase